MTVEKDFFAKPCVKENSRYQTMINTYTFKSPIGFLKISEENDRLIGLSLQQKEADSAPLQNSARHSELLYEAYKQINEYFSGKRKRFELPIHGKGTAFQRQVWEELQKIPYGETRSYEDIAVGIGNPKAVRAVGQANSKNPLLIIVPCHRVIHKNGSITGFACGTDVKKYLLDLEKGNS